MAKKPLYTSPKSVAAILHDEAKRKNIPTAEHQRMFKNTTRTQLQSQG